MVAGMDYSVPIIDVRSAAAYGVAHIAGSTSIPVAEMSNRMHELPRRSQPVAVCGDAVSLSAACQFLVSKGYHVMQKIEWTPQREAELSVGGKLETGSFSQQLWQPAPLLKRFVEVIAPAQGITPGKGLDIACGSGRDLVYFAMQGWDMTGVDHTEAALQRAQHLAASQQVSITTECRDLETGADPFADCPPGSFDLICVARYLHRPLFPHIRRIMGQGGVLIYQTFMQGCEQTAIGRPRNPNFLLRPGELADTFADMDILLDEVEILEDGRPVSAFICRKPGNSAKL